MKKQNKKLIHNECYLENETETRNTISIKVNYSLSLFKLDFTLLIYNLLIYLRLCVYQTPEKNLPPVNDQFWIDSSIECWTFCLKCPIRDEWKMRMSEQKSWIGNGSKDISTHTKGMVDCFN